MCVAEVRREHRPETTCGSCRPCPGGTDDARCWHRIHLSARPEVNHRARGVRSRCIAVPCTARRLHHSTFSGRPDTTTWPELDYAQHPVPVVAYLVLEQRSCQPVSVTNPLGTSEGPPMTITFKIPQGLFSEIHRDLSRPHGFAAERVGFIACGASAFGADGLLLLGDTYHPVAERHYVDDPRVGAMMNSDAIRSALEIAYNRNVAMFHVHRHEHYGKPGFSRVDRRESARFVPDFFKVRPVLPHGVLVLSHDSMAGLCWLARNKHPVEIQEFVVVGTKVPSLRAIA